jgi:hypothetical protein
MPPHIFTFESVFIGVPLSNYFQASPASVRDARPAAFSIGPDSGGGNG